LYKGKGEWAMLRERERITNKHLIHFFSCCYAVPIFILPCTKSEQSALLLYILNLGFYRTSNFPTKNQFATNSRRGTISFYQNTVRKDE